jgi:hypothetical protein
MEMTCLVSSGRIKKHQQQQHPSSSAAVGKLFFSLAAVVTVVSIVSINVKMVQALSFGNSAKLLQSAQKTVCLV